MTRFILAHPDYYFFAVGWVAALLYKLGAVGLALFFVVLAFAVIRELQSQHSTL